MAGFESTDNDCLTSDSGAGEAAFGRRTYLKLAGISSVSLAGLAGNAAASSDGESLDGTGYGAPAYGAAGYGGIE